MTVRYERLLHAVARMTGTDTGVARAAAEATLTALARSLPSADRARLLDALPPELTDDFPMGDGARYSTQREFVRAVSLLGRRPPEQARLRAQAVLAALAEQEPELVAELRVPDDLRPLFEVPAVGGGTYGPAGHAAPLTAAEVSHALDRLPEWTGDTRALRRTITMPPENLDRVLARIDLLRRNLGRGPDVRRARSGDSADLIVSTASVDAVTALDVDLAARIDEVIDDAGAGMAPPP